MPQPSVPRLRSCQKNSMTQDVLEPHSHECSMRARVS
jgi:hypothetical protein